MKEAENEKEIKFKDSVGGFRLVVKRCVHTLSGGALGPCRAREVIPHFLFKFLDVSQR